MGRIGDFLHGYRRAWVADADTGNVFDMMYREEIKFTGERRTGGGVSFTVTADDWAKFDEFCGSEGIEYTVYPMRGVPVILAFLKHRPMLILGAIIFAAWTFYSGRIIWSVEIEGNTKTPTADIVELLAELGCGVGDDYTKINFNRLHADYAARQHDIAWLSVYMNGTVAEVQVRELYKDERPRHEEGIYANIVATTSGIVEAVNVRSGQAAVKIGDRVTAGQVLISGVMEMKNGEVRYEYAEGEVICRVGEAFQVEISPESREKVYTGVEKEEKTVKIFKKSVKLFINGGFDTQTCDKINKIEQLCLFNEVNLPLWVETTAYREYEWVTKKLSPEEMAHLAMSELSSRLSEIAESATMVTKEISYSTVNDGTLVVDCSLVLSRDIGETKEFTAK